MKRTNGASPRCKLCNSILDADDVFTKYNMCRLCGYYVCNLYDISEIEDIDIANEACAVIIESKSG